MNNQTNYALDAGETAKVQFVRQQIDGLSFGISILTALGQLVKKGADLT